jgi:hypothetical protein
MYVHTERARSSRRANRRMALMETIMTGIFIYKSTQLLYLTINSYTRIMTSPKRLMRRLPSNITYHDSIDK